MNPAIIFKTLLIILLLANNAYAESIYDLFVQHANKNHGTQSLKDNRKEIINLGKYNKGITGIPKGSRISFRAGDKNFIFNVKTTRKKSADRFSFSASGPDNDALYVAEKNGRVVGSLHHQGKLYKLRPNTNGDTLLVEVPRETLVDHDDSYYEEFEHNFLSNDDLLEKNDSESEFTVIVAYTPQFSSAAGNVDAYMDLLELETNTSYENSDVNTSVKIVHYYQTNYNDTGSFYADIDYFSNTGNPQTQELYNLRNTYNADIMIVLTGNNYSFCGIARAIGATEDQALALGRESCATGYYTFAHEIGHLFGARHIISQDPNVTPFSFGHGYCNVTANTWRTVMAYGCPPGTGGQRIQQWSNPDVFINNQATGTIDVEFNAKVMNLRAEEVANFRISSSPFDVNGDGCVDQNDLIEMLPHLGNPVPPAPASLDVNGNLIVDIVDYNLVFDNSGLGCQ
ncbi:M12 family metallo-peptidase [Microbulbifer sp. 2205BS26-8]|uniref:M12 family metallo-peptidase n=1 Tax=Microbulbifer sp. 2205BS26-8 TaxID=3064386 RepID=UPI00273E0A27|nr:M12 family metallo-peptidase [Microbulbifer sp. 2205BS26-8]MDP5211034.1 M12 family metallo-peptidase [Microbulbifer sp. 2205BS26-8]